MESGKGGAGDPAEGWLEVVRSEDVGAKPVAVHGLCRDLVCYRGWSGRLHVVDGRCPHMGVSFARQGIVDGEGLCCRFHGWTWDGGGRHIRMSWQGRAMAMFDLRSYPVREVDGRVWIRPTWDSQRSYSEFTSRLRRCLDLCGLTAM